MADEVASRNGDEQVREEVMAYVRTKARDLALQGLSEQVIVAHIDGGALNLIERELLERIAREEVEQARRPVPGDSQRSRS